MGDIFVYNKGCNCKRSGCLKNYCECYQAKIPCSWNCKCVGCRNTEDTADLDMDPANPNLKASLPSTSNSAAGQKRTYAVDPNVPINKENITTEPGVFATPPIDNQQGNIITQDVVDATIECMMTQAGECEKYGLPEYQTERMVLEELARCLAEVADVSIRNNYGSYGQN